MYLFIVYAEMMQGHCLIPNHACRLGEDILTYSSQTSPEPHQRKGERVDQEDKTRRP
jgi:hypothetical protein